MAGRPIPSRLKVLNGSAAHHPERRNPDEPQPEPLSEIPVPPYPLRGRARQAWDDLAARAVALGVLTDADLPALAATCEAFAKAKSTGQVGWHKAYMDGLARFGLDPANRARIHTSPKGQPSKMAGLLQPRRQSG